MFKSGVAGLVSAGAALAQEGVGEEVLRTLQQIECAADFLSGQPEAEFISSDGMRRLQDAPPYDGFLLRHRAGWPAFELSSNLSQVIGNILVDANDQFLDDEARSAFEDPTGRRKKRGRGRGRGHASIPKGMRMAGRFIPGWPEMPPGELVKGPIPHIFTRPVLASDEDWPSRESESYAYDWTLSNTAAEGPLPVAAPEDKEEKMSSRGMAESSMFLIGKSNADAESHTQVENADEILSVAPISERIPNVRMLQCPSVESLRAALLSMRTLPHLAVAGQTGAGKSSLIQHVLRSKTTKHRGNELELLQVDKRFVLVDVPGPSKEVDKVGARPDFTWRLMAMEYIRSATSLRAMLYLHDVRSVVSGQARAFFNEVQSIGLPVLLVLTKDDALLPEVISKMKGETHSEWVALERLAIEQAKSHTHTTPIFPSCHTPFSPACITDFLF